METMENLLKGFGIEQTDSGEVDEAEKLKETEAEKLKEAGAGEAGVGAGTGEVGAGEEAEKSKEAGDPNSKIAQTFAQMRIQNKQLNDLVKGIAGVLGVQDTSKPEALTQALQQKVLEAQSKQQGVPPEVLQRLQTLEQQNQYFTQEEFRRQAYLGFQRIKDEFSLDDKGLNAFADQLLADGVNPFEQPVDLMSAYISRNYKRLLTEAEEKGAQKEAERSTKAGKHSSSPGSKTGQQQEEPTKITTISDLNAWMAKSGVAQ